MQGRIELLSSPALHDLVNALERQVEFPSESLETLVSGIVATDLGVALSFRYVFFCHGTLGEGNVSVKQIKHTLDGDVERG